MMLRQAHIPAEETLIERSVDGRFHGQLHEIQVTLPADFDGMRLEDFVERFNAKYRELYHYVPDHTPIELLTWRTRVSGLRAPVHTAPLPKAGPDPARAFKATRPACFKAEDGYMDTPIYDRYRLGAGMEIAGPAIIEERESTIVIRPGMLASVDAYGNVHIYLAPSERSGEG